jgi:hypothetical protein
MTRTPFAYRGIYKYQIGTYSITQYYIAKIRESDIHDKHWHQTEYIHPDGTLHSSCGGRGFHATEVGAQRVLTEYLRDYDRKNYRPEITLPEELFEI